MKEIDLKNKYINGDNISSILRKKQNLSFNTREIIEISYDLQTGSYINALQDKEYEIYKEYYTKKIARIIQSLCKPTSILEAGVGEATTLSGVVNELDTEVDAYGFDISWSRVMYGKNWLQSHNVKNVKLCTGDLFNIPFLDNSIDVVYTSHSIEPNGGNEEAILKELYRVTKKFLILLEPGYELASSEAKERMDYHGYCKNLKETSVSLGFDVLEHSLLSRSATKLNPTALTIISKEINDSYSYPNTVFACPKYKTPLKEISNMLFSPDALMVYPLVGGIHCLRIENGILASKYEELEVELLYK